MSTKAAQRDARSEVVQTSRTKGERITLFLSPKGRVWWTDTFTARPAPEELTEQLEGFELPATIDIKVGRLTAPHPADSAHPKPGAIAQATELVIRRALKRAKPVRPTGERFDNGAGTEVVELRGEPGRVLLDERDADLLNANRLLVEDRERKPRPVLARSDDGIEGVAMGVLEAEKEQS